MIAENYWIYQFAFWMSGVVFTLPMEKKENFGRRIGFSCVATIICAIIIGIVPGDHTFLTEAVWRLFSCTVLIVILKSCWEISWSVAVYNMIWGVSIWQIVVEGTTLLALLHGDADFDSWLSKAIIISFYLISYFLCYMTIAKWMPIGRKEHLGPRQMSLSLALFSISSLLSFHEKIEGVTILPHEWGYFYLIQLICLVVLYLEGELFKKSQLKQEMEMLNLMYLTQQEQYRISKENIALINQKCHDLKHQIRALRNADKEELDKYLGEIEESVGIYEAIVKTGNDVFDTILTEKSLYCKARQIQVSCVADASQLGFIDTIDLYSVLGNVMDNAIEAVEKFEEKEKRQIDVLIYRQHNFVVVNIINPMEEHLNYEDGLPITTKRDKNVHGFGLQSVRQILKKYDGFLNVSEEDGCFSLKMLIPIRLKVTT